MTDLGSTLGSIFINPFGRRGAKKDRQIRCQYLYSLLVGVHRIGEAVRSGGPERVSKVDPGVRVIRIVVGSLAEAVDGFLDAALVLVNVSKVVVGKRIVRLELNGLLVCRDGLREHLLLSVCAAKIVVGIHVGRVLSQSIQVAEDGLVELSTILERRS